MALTVSQIMQVAAPAVAKEMNRRYILGSVQERPEWGGYITGMFDPYSGDGVRIAWSRNDEIKLTSERMKIDFVKALLENAVHSLDLFIEEKNKPVDDVQEVDFSE